MAGGSHRDSRVLELPDSGLGGVSRCLPDQGTQGGAAQGRRAGPGVHGVF